jgi:hypothetical protein
MVYEENGYQMQTIQVIYMYKFWTHLRCICLRYGHLLNYHIETFFVTEFTIYQMSLLWRIGDH